jgi:hypothetical protein
LWQQQHNSPTIESIPPGNMPNKDRGPSSTLHSSIICYVDASTSPDLHHPSSRRAGLGIFIINLQVQPANTFYIRASLGETHSVVSTEAAVMALAADLLHKIDFQHVTFLSDCAQLMAFLNSQDHSNLPDWRMKVHTQLFDDATLNRMPKVIKIHRNLKSTAHTLASLAFSSLVVPHQNYIPICSYEHLDHQCPLLDALTIVSLVQIRILI